MLEDLRLPPAIPGALRTRCQPPWPLTGRTPSRPSGGHGKSVHRLGVGTGRFCGTYRLICGRRRNQGDFPRVSCLDVRNYHLIEVALFLLSRAGAGLRAQPRHPVFRKGECEACARETAGLGSKNLATTPNRRIPQCVDATWLHLERDVRYVRGGRIRVQTVKHWGLLRLRTQDDLGHRCLPRQRKEWVRPESKHPGLTMPISIEFDTQRKTSKVTRRLRRKQHH